jgi:Flp pilus assembly protein TadG
VTDCRGNLTIEFAVLVPLFLLLAIGVFDIGMVILERLQLEFAVEASAKCLAIGNALCPTTGATSVFAATLIPPAFGVLPDNFVATKTATIACVKASFAYSPMVIPMTIPLASNVCYPVGP